MSMTCFLIGHRDAPESVFFLLKQAIEQHITSYGVTEFVIGHYGAFDRMAARAVREAKLLHPNVKLVLLLPYYQPDAASIEDGFDGTVYPEGQEAVPKRAAIVRANKYMIAHCNFLICYQRHIGSNARDCVEYARKQYQRTGRPHIVNLAEPMD